MAVGPNVNKYLLMRFENLYCDTDITSDIKRNTDIALFSSEHLAHFIYGTFRKFTLMSTCRTFFEY